MISWQNITLDKFQQLHRLSQHKPEPGLATVEYQEQLVASCYGLTLDEVGELPYDEMKRRLAAVTQMLEGKAIPGKAQTSFRIGGKPGRPWTGRKFFITYDIAKIKQRQFVELLTYGQAPIENMHRILASIVQPVYGIFRPKARPNSADEHAEIAALMLEAPITILYHTAVFFCRLYSLLLRSMQSGTVADMMNQGMTRETAEYLCQLSISTTDGYIAPTGLQSLNA